MNPAVCPPSENPIFCELKHLFLQGKLSQCYLFYGPLPPLGFQTQEETALETALHFSTFILASNEKDPTEQNLVSTRKHMTQKTHPNFFELAPELGKNEILVDDARKLTTFLQSTPTLPGWRAVLIHPAHALNDSSANALLKMMEELPAKTVIFLVAHSLYTIKSTLLSRSQKIFFAPSKLVGSAPENLAAWEKTLDDILQDLLFKKKWPEKERLEPLFKEEILAVLPEKVKNFLYKQAIHALSDSSVDLWATRYEKVSDFINAAENKALSPLHFVSNLFVQLAA
ncbi:hypothetical protein AGMMS49949_07840 [Alphaproteobacteria bacterium]|nr:hypothetical protein AGMMS49949_07840 [Alphaproteobacteria bacterium]GHS98732.1 hypothetical protein AGMMS50296_6580 [Alphaproteobacteria bacterium]